MLYRSSTSCRAARPARCGAGAGPPSPRRPRRPTRLKKNKRRYPDSTIVQDDTGAALKAWQLQTKNAAVIIVSAQGDVLYFKQGALSDAEITEVVDIVAQQVEQQAP